MQRITYILLSICILFNLSLKGQCDVIINNSTIQHVVCPGGGAVGSASILQSNFTNYWWTNITTGQQNSNFGTAVTSVNNLDAGFYVITATDPFNNSCPSLVYSDTFEIIEASPIFQFYPDQACPDICNVSISADMEIAITGVNYSMYFDSFFLPVLPVTIQNQCGGTHTYSINADGISCGNEVIGVSQFAPMNLQTSVVDQNCNQPGSADVLITGVGASALSTYCTSSPQFDNYTIIENVILNGDNTSINNNTSGICNSYADYTNLSSDLSPGSTYSITIDLGTCSNQGTAWIDLANIFVDWNIDGDFDDLGELVGQINPTQSPSSHIITFNVPIGAIPGQSRMRIVSQSTVSQSTNSAQACDNQVAYFGETEDYTIVVVGSVSTPVSYLWSDGQTSSIATNLIAGTYSVIVTDANGCTANDTIVVSGGGVLNTAINPALQTVCHNTNPDTIFLISSGPLGSYQYEWWSYSTGSQSPQAVIIPNQNDSFLIPPTDSIGIAYYYSVVTSSFGCVDTSSIVTLEVVSYPEIILEPKDSTVCIGSNLTINIEDTFFVDVASNVITPIYQWYQGSTCDINSASPATGSGSNTDTYSPQTTIVGTQYYFCIVTIPQIIGCNSDTSFCAEITVNPNPSVLLNAIPNPACLGDDITLSTTSSIPVSNYRFQYNLTGNWSGWTDIIGGNGWGNSSPVNYNNITQSTDFRVKVKEYNGCNSSSWSPTITIPIVTFGSLSIWHN